MFEVGDVVKCVKFNDQHSQFQGRETTVTEVSRTDIFIYVELAADIPFVLTRFKLIRKGYNTICI